MSTEKELNEALEKIQKDAKLVTPGTFLYLAVDKSQSNLAIVRNAVNKHINSLK